MPEHVSFSVVLVILGCILLAISPIVIFDNWSKTKDILNNIFWITLLAICLGLTISFFAFLGFIGLIIYPLIFIFKKVKNIERDDLVELLFIVLASIWVLSIYITIPLHGRWKEIRSALKRTLEGEEVIVEGYIVSFEKRVQDPIFPSSNNYEGDIKTIKIPHVIVIILDKTLGKEINVVFDYDSFKKFNPKKDSNVRYICTQGGLLGWNKIYFEYPIYQA